MKSTVLFGSSYVERLRRSCNGDLGTPGTTIVCGRGGLRTDRMHQPTLQKALEAGADVAFIHVGGNDIEADSRPRAIFNRIVSLVETMHGSGITRVWVAEILTRGLFRAPGLTKDVFEKQRLKISTLLFKKYGSDFVQFRDMRYPVDYLPDLVHLQTRETSSTNTVMKKYASRIRRCIWSS
ncbi:hypothetical protein KP79_PYT01078 [Mizuhopecten yessoensis]|uniref:SGNH hydrolase-type esterase domain-containing protein n=1 Tax=Mizuhopecten yessoensis TaxID=6573 RepID=A0A210QKY3_MIZYE|nr:hypothetical protein KP79_PYT01078 [Mizuhopecten yessoensis]